MKYLIIILFFLFSIGVHSQDAENIKSEWEKMNQSKSKQKTYEWFKNAKYGMFIHWGIYSVPAGVWKGKKQEELRGPKVSEWIQYSANIPRDEYAQIAKDFNPTKFDADVIAKLASDAGMKYLVITTKHHDGFAMYDSKASNFDIMDASPFKRDIIKELYDACKKHGVEFGIYYSHNIDWHDGNDCQYGVLKAQNITNGLKNKTFGANLWDPSPNTFDEYLKNKAFPQVDELMELLPDMKCLWYDMAQFMTPQQSLDFYKAVYDKQPQIIINERVGNDLGDYEIPGDNKIPKNAENISKPWETVGTFNNSWGYKSYDNDWKSPEEVLFWLIEIVSKGGNYMLNIGPKATGEVPHQSVSTLLEIGNWLKINGHAIYNTSRWEVTHEGPTDVNMGGTMQRRKEGFTIQFTSADYWFTSNGKYVYAIALKYPENNKGLIKSLSSQNIKSVELIGSSEKVSFNISNEGLEYTLPNERPNKNGYVLNITLR